MHFRDLFMIMLIAISFVRSELVRAKRVSCDLQVRETRMMDGMKLAVVTPKNYAKLVCALKCCKIEKAVVAGWNDHLRVYVLYDNGAVVPGEELTLPNYALYERTDRYCRTEIFVVINCTIRNKMKCYRIICRAKETENTVFEIRNAPVQNVSSHEQCYAVKENVGFVCEKVDT